jgi:hypothetical protein
MLLAFVSPPLEVFHNRYVTCASYVLFKYEHIEVIPIPNQQKSSLTPQIPCTFYTKLCSFLT